MTFKGNLEKNQSNMSFGMSGQEVKNKNSFRGAQTKSQRKRDQKIQDNDYLTKEQQRSLIENTNQQNKKQFSKIVVKRDYLDQEEANLQEIRSKFNKEQNKVDSLSPRSKNISRVYESRDTNSLENSSVIFEDLKLKSYKKKAADYQNTKSELRTETYIAEHSPQYKRQSSLSPDDDETYDSLDNLKLQEIYNICEQPRTKKSKKIKQTSQLQPLQKIVNAGRSVPSKAKVVNKDNLRENHVEIRSKNEFCEVEKEEELHVVKNSQNKKMGILDGQRLTSTPSIKMLLMTYSEKSIINNNN